MGDMESIQHLRLLQQIEDIRKVVPQLDKALEEMEALIAEYEHHPKANAEVFALYRAETEVLKGRRDEAVRKLRVLEQATK